MKKSLWVTVGFLLFIFGFLSIILKFIGLNLTFLTWMEIPGPTVGFLIKILMIVAGIVIVYLSTTNWQEQEE